MEDVNSGVVIVGVGGALGRGLPGRWMEHQEHRQGAVGSAKSSRSAV